MRINVSLQSGHRNRRRARSTSAKTLVDGNPQAEENETERSDLRASNCLRVLHGIVNVSTDAPREQDARNTLAYNYVRDRRVSEGLARAQAEPEPTRK